MWAKQKQSGFTIVELLIVIVVIGILAAITIVAYTGVQTRARDNIRKSDISQIVKAIESFYAVNGNYPLYSGWCTQMSNPAHSAEFNAEIASFMPKVPTDPSYKLTHQDYLYHNLDDQSYRLYAELEASDLSDDGLISSCVRTNNTANEYDYRYPLY